MRSAPSAATIPPVFAPVARLPVLRPFARFLGGLYPVLERDYLVLTATGRFVITRTVVVGVPIVLLIILLTSEVVGSSYALQRVAEYIMFPAIAIVPPLLALVGLVLGASSIASERSRHTLSLVLAAPVGAASLVAAKFLSRFGVVLLLFLGLLPAIAACLIYPGVSPALFAQFVSVTAGAVMLAVACGVCASAFSRRVVAAVVGGFVIWLLLVGGHLAVVIGWAAANNFPPPPTTGWAVLWDGAWHLVLIGLQVDRGGRPAPFGHEPLAWDALVSAVLLLVATWRVHRENATGGRRKRARKLRRMRFADPVLDRTLRGSLGYRPSAGGWVELGLFVLLFGLSYTGAIVGNDFDDEEFHGGILAGATGLMCLFVLVRSSQLVAEERSTGALSLLRVTSLGDREIIRSKVRGVILTQRWFAALCLLHMVIAEAASDFRVVPSLLVWLPTTWLLVNVFALVGAHVSCRVRRPGASVVASFLLLVGWGVLLALAIWFVDETINERELEEFLLFGIPAVLPTVPLVELQDDGFWGLRPRYSLSFLAWFGIYLAAVSQGWKWLPTAFRQADAD